MAWQRCEGQRGNISGVIGSADSRCGELVYPERIPFGVRLAWRTYEAQNSGVDDQVCLRGCEARRTAATLIRWKSGVRDAGPSSGAGVPSRFHRQADG
jgi:hypothetical protein